MFSTVVKMSTTGDFTYKHMNDYCFERLNKMPLLILHMIYHMIPIIIRELNTFGNVYTIINLISILDIIIIIQ